jgi:hypothetical protein
MKISHYLLAGIAGLLITPSIFVAHCQNPEYCLSLYQTMKDSCVTQYQTCVADHEANCTAREQSCFANAEEIYQSCLHGGGSGASASLSFRESNRSIQLWDVSRLSGPGDKSDAPPASFVRTTLLTGK